MSVNFQEAGNTLNEDEAAIDVVLRRELVHKEKSQRHLMEVMHQFRTPLKAVLSSVQALSGEVYGGLGDPRYKNEAVSVYRSVQYLLRMCDEQNFPSSGQDAAGSAVLLMKKTDARVVIDDVVKMFRMTAKSCNVDLSFEVDDDFPLLDIEPEHLSQILVSVVSDAITHTPEGGVINIDAALGPCGGAVILMLQDFSIGEPLDELRGSQKPYNQKTHRNTGDAMGLIIASRMMDGLGGELTLSSMETLGTIVSLVFPVECFSEGRTGKMGSELTYPLARKLT